MYSAIMTFYIGEQRKIAQRSHFWIEFEAKFYSRELKKFRCWQNPFYMSIADDFEANGKENMNRRVL